MEIILKKDVENLGLEFDTVIVKPGYARNFLIPKGYAVLATSKNKLELAKILEERKEEEEKLISAANAVVEKLKKTNISIATKVGTGDKLFGSINNIHLAEAFAKEGIDIDRKYIKIPGNTIKRVGKFFAKVRLHREVEYDYEFEVISEDASVKSKKTESNESQK